MWYVYIISGQKDFTYIGFTNNLYRRFNQHNKGLCQSTKPYKPFSLEVFIAFKCQKKALEFEKYLKSHSGTSFMRKRIL